MSDDDGPEASDNSTLSATTTHGSRTHNPRIPSRDDHDRTVTLRCTGGCDDDCSPATGIADGGALGLNNDGWSGAWGLLDDDGLRGIVARLRRVPWTREGGRAEDQGTEEGCGGSE